jgi:hypothetical protein
MSECDNILSDSSKNNKEILKIIQLTSQELVRLKGNDDFYKDAENAEKFINIISGTCEISIRLIDHFVTKYSKFNKCNYKLVEGDKETNFNVHYDYKNQLKNFQKTYFDPFSRGDRIPFFMKDTCIITTIGQLNFFKWFISRKIFDHLITKKSEVYNDMNIKNKNDTKIIKKIYNNYKMKDKKKPDSYRKPLMVQTKIIDKQSINIMVSFD